MGVLPCAVYRCQNIMCDRLSDTYGYICWECFDRLLDLGVQVDLEEFFATEPPSNPKETREATYNYFNSLFPDTTRNSSDYYL